ncbi:N-acetylmuramidase family protein [Brevundimonas sp. BAL450]|nr:N-acetylmuramidase family protein [Brevundimonas sp. BAL450]
MELDLTDQDFADAAARLRCSPAQIRAVFEVEASGAGWFTDVRGDILALDGPGGFIDGAHLPKILFEAHIFDRETKGRFRAAHPNLSSPRWNRALYVGGQGEYERLNRAMQLDRTAALRSASWGAPQIMGFNHKLAGFDTVDAFVDAMKSGVRAHLMAFVAFVENSGLAPALRQITTMHASAIPFARGYNGAGYAKNEYHIKIARAFAKWSRA